MAKHEPEEDGDKFRVGGGASCSNPAVLPPHEVMLPEDMNEVKAVLSKGDPSLAFEDSGAGSAAAGTGDDASMTYKCNHCVKTFPTRMALAQHKKKHTMLNRVLKGAGRKAKSENFNLLL